MNIIKRFIKWEKESVEERKRVLRSVPRYCSECYLLYHCRDKNNNYKCFHGCIKINFKESIPPKCVDCLLLNICRDELNHGYYKHKGCLLHRKGEEYKL